MPIYKFPTSEANFIESWTLALEAGRPAIVEAYGRAFSLLKAGAPLQMNFNNGKYFDMGRGRWSLQDNERYTSLRFLSQTAQTIRFLTGNFVYTEDPVIQVAQTRAFPGAASSIAAGANIDLNAVPAGMTYRKAVVVTNNDAGTDLDIYTQDATGTWQLAGTVFHLQAWYLETSDAVRIHNPSLGVVNLRICELFYQTQ